MIEIIAITISATIGSIIAILKLYKKMKCKSECCDIIIETDSKAAEIHNP